MNTISLHSLNTKKKYHCNNGGHDSKSCSACLRSGVHTLIASKQHYQQLFTSQSRSQQNENDGDDEKEELSSTTTPITEIFAVVSEKEMLMRPILTPAEQARKRAAEMTLLENNNENNNNEVAEVIVSPENAVLNIPPQYISFRWLMFTDESDYVKPNRQDLSQMLLLAGADPLPPLQERIPAFPFEKTSTVQAEAILLAPLLQPIVAEDAINDPALAFHSDRDVLLEKAATALADLADLCNLVGCDRPLYLIQGQCLTLSGTNYLVEQTDPAGCIVKLCDETDVALAEPISRPNELFHPPLPSSSSTTHSHTSNSIMVTAASNAAVTMGQQHVNNINEQQQQEQQISVSQQQQNNNNNNNVGSPRRGLMALAAGVSPGELFAKQQEKRGDMLLASRAPNVTSNPNQITNNNQIPLSPTPKKQQQQQQQKMMSHQNEMKDVATSPIVSSSSANNNNNNNNLLLLSSNSRQRRQQQQQQQYFNISPVSSPATLNASPINEDHNNNENPQQQQQGEEEGDEGLNFIDETTTAITSAIAKVSSWSQRFEELQSLWKKQFIRRNFSNTNMIRQEKEKGEQKENFHETEEENFSPSAATTSFSSQQQQQLETPIHLVALLQKLAIACNELQRTNNDVAMFLIRGNAHISQLLYTNPTPIECHNPNSDLEVLLVLSSNPDATCVSLELEGIRVSECWAVPSGRCLYVAIPSKDSLSQVEILKIVQRGTITVLGEPCPVTRLHDHGVLDDLHRMLSWHDDQVTEIWNQLQRQVNWNFIMEVWGSQLASLVRDVRVEHNRIELLQQTSAATSNSAFHQVEAALEDYRQNSGAGLTKDHLVEVVANFSHAVAHEVAGEEDTHAQNEILFLWKVFEQIGLGYELVVSRLPAFRTKLLVSRLEPDEVQQESLRSCYQGAIEKLREFQIAAAATSSVRVVPVDEYRNRIDKLVQVAQEVDVFSGEKVAELWSSENRFFTEFLKQLEEVKLLNEEK